MALTADRQSTLLYRWWSASKWKTEIQVYKQSNQHTVLTPTLVAVLPCPPCRGPAGVPWWPLQCPAPGARSQVLASTGRTLSPTLHAGSSSGGAVGVQMYIMYVGVYSKMSFYKLGRYQCWNGYWRPPWITKHGGTVSANVELDMKI